MLREAAIARLPEEAAGPDSPSMST